MPVIQNLVLQQRGFGVANSGNEQHTVSFCVHSFSASVNFNLSPLA
jgi:hypothetical protein